MPEITTASLAQNAVPLGQHKVLSHKMFLFIFTDVQCQWHLTAIIWPTTITYYQFFQSTLILDFAWGIAEVKSILATAVWSVCLSVYLSLTAFPHYSTDPDVTWWNGKGCPLVVHYWAGLQSVHVFRCYDNIHVRKLIALFTANAHSAEHEMSASACTYSVAGYNL